MTILVFCPRCHVLVDRWGGDYYVGEEMELCEDCEPYEEDERAEQTCREPREGAQASATTRATADR